MAIEIVGTATSNSSTVTIPAHQAGDLLLIYAFRSGSTTRPTLPTGWTSERDAGANTCSARFGYRWATGSGTTSGTWTNASRLVCYVLRGVDTSTPWDDEVMGTGSGSTVSWQNHTVLWPGENLVIRWGGHRTATSFGAMTGYTTRVVSSSGNPLSAGFDSDGPVSGSTTGSGSVTANTSSGWIAQTTEFHAAPATALAAPTGLTASTWLYEHVQLDWSAVTGATGYSVYRDGVFAGQTANLSFQDTAGTPNTLHSYTVTATNAEGESDPSAAVSGRFVPLAQARTFTEDFEALADGTVLTSSNSAFDQVTGTATGTVLDDAPLQGSRSLQIVASSALLQLRNLFAEPVGARFMRVKLRFDSVIASNVVVLGVRQGTTLVGTVMVRGTDGKIVLRGWDGSALTVVGTSSFAVTQGTPVRLEVAYVADWHVTLRIFHGANLDGETPDETVTGVHHWSGWFDNWITGLTGSSTHTVTFDEFAADSGDWVGPEAAAETASGGASASVGVSATGGGVAVEAVSAGAAAAVSVAVAGAGVAVEAASGGAAASVGVPAAGAGTGAETAAGGAAVAVPVAAVGAGAAVEGASAGAASAVVVAAAGAGAPAEAAAAGAVASVLTSAVGAGVAAEEAASGAAATVAVTASGAGSGEQPQHLSGGASATVGVAAAGAGDGTELVAGGAGATVTAVPAGAGTGAETATGGASATVAVAAAGGGGTAEMQHASGGAAASVGVTTTAGGTAAEAVAAGAATTVGVVSGGAGTAAEAAAGGAGVFVGVVAGGDGAGLEFTSGGAAALVTIAAVGGGTAAGPYRDVQLLAVVGPYGRPAGMGGPHSRPVRIDGPNSRPVAVGGPDGRPVAADGPAARPVLVHGPKG